MDNLRYTYDGNKLTSVTDLEGIVGFKDGTNTVMITPTMPTEI